MDIEADNLIINFKTIETLQQLCESLHGFKILLKNSNLIQENNFNLLCDIINEKIPYLFNIYKENIDNCSDDISKYLEVSHGFDALLDNNPEIYYPKLINLTSCFTANIYLLCKDSELIYKNKLPLVADSLTNLFQVCHKMQIKSDALLKDIVITQNNSSLINQAISSILSYHSEAIHLDVKILSTNWKTIYNLSSSYSELIEGNTIVRFLVDDIIVANLLYCDTVDNNSKSRLIKFCEFLLKLFANFYQIIQSGRSHDYSNFILRQFKFQGNIENENDFNLISEINGKLIYLFIYSNENFKRDLALISISPDDYMDFINILNCILDVITQENKQIHIKEWIYCDSNSIQMMAYNLIPKLYSTLYISDYTGDIVYEKILEVIYKSISVDLDIMERFLFIQILSNDCSYQKCVIVDLWTIISSRLPYDCIYNHCSLLTKILLKRYNIYINWMLFRLLSKLSRDDTERYISTFKIDLLKLPLSHQFLQNKFVQSGILVVIQKSSDIVELTGALSILYKDETFKDISLIINCLFSNKIYNRYNLSYCLIGAKFFMKFIDSFSQKAEFLIKDFLNVDNDCIKSIMCNILYSSQRSQIKDVLSYRKRLLNYLNESSLVYTKCILKEINICVDTKVTIVDPKSLTNFAKRFSHKKDFDHDFLKNCEYIIQSIIVEANNPNEFDIALSHMMNKCNKLRNFHHDKKQKEYSASQLNLLKININDLLNSL